MGFQKGHKFYKGGEKGWFKKGNIPYNLGKKCPETSGENNGTYKGDNAKYTAKHMWIYSKLGKANKCENKNCSYPRKTTRGRLLLKPSRFEWANISKKYKRDINDWIMLCTMCHSHWDRNINLIKL